LSKRVVTSIATVLIALGAAPTPRLRAQQPTAGLSLPFTITTAGNSGTEQTAGVLRIMQFFELNGQALALGTLTVGAAQPVPGAAPPNSASSTSFVTQVVVPLLAASSATAPAALTFSGATGAMTVSSTAASAGVINAASTVAAAVGTAGVPSSSTPGQVANCGPLHLEVGPIDTVQQGVQLHLDRLAVDVGAPAGLTTGLNQVLCSADGVIAQVASSGVGTASTRLATPGAAAPQAPTPLLGLVSVLNQVLGVM
jgi:hypothetical protein